MITPQLKSIVTKISDGLDKVGLFYIVTCREKTLDSIKVKIENKKTEPYSSSGKKIQDVYGVRIVCYFREDVDIVKLIVSNMFMAVEESTVIDIHGEEVFRAERYNVVCKISSGIIPSFNNYRELIDDTFELQIRTIFSEGWHEVEHDLRYKRKDDWSEENDLSRLLNSFFASIQSSEWGLKCLFDTMAHRALDKNNLESFLINKLKIRMSGKLTGEIKNIATKSEALKNTFRSIERSSAIMRLMTLPTRLILSYENIIFYLNYFYAKDPKIYELTPSILRYHFGQVN